MAEEIAFENGRISNFKGLVTLTLTLDRVILHTVVDHSSHSWTDGHFETGDIRSTLSNSRPNNNNNHHHHHHAVSTL